MSTEPTTEELAAWLETEANTHRASVGYGADSQRFRAAASRLRTQAARIEELESLQKQVAYARWRDARSADSKRARLERVALAIYCHRYPPGLSTLAWHRDAIADAESFLAALDAHEKAKEQGT